MDMMGKLTEIGAELRFEVNPVYLHQTESLGRSTTGWSADSCSQHKLQQYHGWDQTKNDGRYEKDKFSSRRFAFSLLIVYKSIQAEYSVMSGKQSN